MTQFPCFEGPGCGAVKLLAGVAGSKDCPQWEQFAGRKVTLTHQARIAIYLACQALGITEGDEILAPAYHCGSEIDSLFRSGATITMYQVDRRAAIDLDDIRRKATRRTRAVYVTHYFGWPHELSPLAAWCRERQILLLEDCALSLFSAGPEGPLGCTGDVSFFSFPKTLPTPDGGAWTQRDALDSPTRIMECPPMWRTLRRSLPLIKRRIVNLMANLGCASLSAQFLMRADPLDDRDESPNPGIPSSYYFDKQTSRWGLSKLTRGVLPSFAPAEIVLRRRRNYSRLLAPLGGLPGVVPLFETLPPGVCPLGLPVFVEDRRWWAKVLRHYTIGAFRWWEGYHDRFQLQGFEAARYLKDHLLVLPVHQDLSDAHIDFVSHRIAALARANHALAGSQSRFQHETGCVR